MKVPIPKRPSGYKLGQANAPVTIELFFDLECPFSRKGWQTLLKVFKSYTPQQLCIVLQPMTLGNHRQSWDATKAAIAACQNNPEKFVSFVSYLFDRQEEFSTHAFKEKTQTDLHQLLASYAIEAGDWHNTEKFIAQLNSEEIYDQARIPARFASVRGVWSTPTFFINGAEVTELSSKSSLADWKSILDPLLE